MPIRHTVCELDIALAGVPPRKIDQLAVFCILAHILNPPAHLRPTVIELELVQLGLAERGHVVASVRAGIVFLDDRDDVVVGGEDVIQDIDFIILQRRRVVCDAAVPGLSQCVDGLVPAELVGFVDVDGDGHDQASAHSRSESTASIVNRTTKSIWVWVIMNL